MWLGANYFTSFESYLYCWCTYILKWTKIHIWPQLPIRGIVSTGSDFRYGKNCEVYSHSCWCKVMPEVCTRREWEKTLGTGIKLRLRSPSSERNSEKALLRGKERKAHSHRAWQPAWSRGFKIQWKEGLGLDAPRKVTFSYLRNSSRGTLPQGHTILKGRLISHAQWNRCLCVGWVWVTHPFCPHHFHLSHENDWGWRPVQETLGLSGGKLENPKARQCHQASRGLGPQTGWWAGPSSGHAPYGLATSLTLWKGMVVL